MAKKLEFSSSERTNIARNSSKVSEKIGFASLHKDLFTHLQDANCRKILRNKFIDHWFQRAFNQKQRFLNNLIKLKELYPREKWRKVDEKRSSAFRKIILNAYDNTCAASGSKLKRVNGSSLLEAAHIIPLEVTTDKRPQNGIALLPTIHVAMDRDLIVPGPDYCWHASEFLKQEADTDEGARWLAQFHGLPLKFANREKITARSKCTRLAVGPTRMDIK